MLLLDLIHYIGDFYYISKARHFTIIKPYSRNDFIYDLLADIVVYLSCLVILGILSVSLIMSPESVLLAAVFSKIKSAIFSTFSSTPYYITLQSTYYEKGLFILLDMLVFDMERFIICNVLNILCFCFIYIYIIPFPFFLLSVRILLLLLCIIYIYKSRAFFKKNVIFLICLTVPLVLLGQELYNIYDWYLLEAYYLLTKNLREVLSGSKPNPNPNPNSGPPGGGPEGGPEWWAAGAAGEAAGDNSGADRPEADQPYTYIDEDLPQQYRDEVQEHMDELERQRIDNRKQYKRVHDKQWNKENPEYKKEYNKKNKEKKREYNKEYNKKNKEKKREYNIQWSEKNKEKKREYNKQWSEKKRGYNKEWKEKNKEK